MEPKKRIDVDPAAVQMTPGGIAIRNLEELMAFANMLVKGEAAPKGWSAGQVAIAIQAGMERGLGLLGGLTQGTVINGRFAWNGQAAAALIRNSPVCKKGSLSFTCVGTGDERKGVARAWRVGDPAEIIREFTIDDARRAELWGKRGPWTQYPNDQLMWRALGRLARALFSDVLGGFPLAEEARDYEPDEPSRTPEGVKPEPKALPSPDPLMQAIAVDAEAIAKAARDVVDDAYTQEEFEVQAENAPDVPAPPTPGETPSCPHGVLFEDACEECKRS